MKTSILSLIIVTIFMGGPVSAVTYYVSKSGNDSNTGRSWESAWATINKVNATISVGDSVRFGSGRWLNSMIIPPYGGTSSTRTAYACSTFSTASQGMTEISSGDSVKNWTLYSGQIYKAKWSPNPLYNVLGNGSYENSHDAFCFVQNDSLLIPQSSLAGVNGPGKFYYDGRNTDTVWVWLWNGGSPSGRECLMSARPTVSFEHSNQSYITFWGLTFKMGKQGVVLFFEQNCSYNLFEHCKMAHISYMSAENPAVIMSRRWNVGENGWCYGNTFRACTIYSAVSIGGPGANEHAGSGVIFYSQRQSVFDSCYFYNLYGDGIYWKNDGAGVPAYGNRASYCIFDGRNQMSTGIGFGVYADRDTVYGCIMMNLRGNAFRLATGVNNYGGHRIWNNTVYNVDKFLEDLGSYAGTFDSLVVKYNIFSVRNPQSTDGYASSSIYSRTASLVPIHSDSNYWYEPTTTLSFRQYGGSTYTWSTWRSSLSKDLHSFNSNPGLTSPASGDFSRPSAPMEIDSIAYGGRIWTRFGAWQGPVVPDTTDPVISSVRSTDTTANSVIIRWNTNEYANSRVEYGLTTGYGTLSTLDPSLVTIHAQTLYGLTASTTFHYRVRSADGSGNETVSGDYTFTTLAPDITPPTITNVQAVGPTSSAVTIGWTTNELSTSQVNYGLTSSYGQSSALNSTMVLNHQVALSGLTANTDYHYRVRSTDASGNERVSGDYTFHTDTISTAYSDLALDVTPTVSSSYTGYTVNPITDGEFAPRGGTGSTWASSESSTLPHWVEINFGRQVMVNRMVISWAYNGARTAFMCARQYYIQYDSSGTFVTRTTVNNSTNDSATTTDFAPIVTTRIRYYQPANMGNALYPTVVWLTEMEVFGTNATNDSIPPAAPSNVRGTPGISLGSIDLQWTAPNDPLNLGQASYYIMKYSNAPIDEDNWDQAMEVITPPLPLPGGLVQNFNVGGLSEGQVYYFALKAGDAFGNISEVSNSDSSFACGIMAPIPLNTVIDTASLTATFSAEIVQSYLPIYYEFSLDTLAQFSNSRFNVDFAADTIASAGFDQLLNEKTYYWRCRSRSSTTSDSSAWSDYVQFRISTSGSISELSSSDCLYPREGNIISTNQPTFTVRYVSGLSGVFIEIDSTRQFNSAIQSGPLAMTANGNLNWKLPIQLESKITYYWRASSDNVTWTNPINFSAMPKIHVYPNPFNAADGDPGVTFTNLPQNSDITISTISGTNIKQVNGVGPDNWLWDTKNDSGDNVAPGVYMYLVDYNGGSASGKVIITR